MIKTILTMVVTAIAGLVGYLVSDSFRERLAQKQRDKIASEVARGDEAAINARIGRFRSFVPWVVVALLVIGGCAVTRTVYVKEQDRVTALRPLGPLRPFGFALRAQATRRLRRGRISRLGHPR